MSNEKQQIDIAIVGGGIVGLWCARSILAKNPELSVVVFEAETYLGEHSSGRNSEVLHSGIYYPTGSLKHLHCLRGNQLWREFIHHRRIPFLGCGKIVAAAGGQADRLETLFQHGQDNGVPGLARLSKAEVAALRSSLHIDQGFFCETSGVLNVAEALLALRADVEGAGGVVMLNSRAELRGRSANGFTIEVGNDEVLATNLVNAAGLFAVRLRAALGLFEYEDFYVKGSYLKLRRKLGLEKLVYPLPPPSGLGLGVHLTLDTAGEQKLGPDTELVDRIYYGVDDSLMDRMYPAICEVFRGVRMDDLQLGYAGIRPKVKKEGSLVADFIFHEQREHKIPGYFEFLGIESPGVTAAPSLAQMLADAI